MKLGFKVVKLPWYVTGPDRRIKDTFYSIYHRPYHPPVYDLPEELGGRTAYKIGEWTTRQPGWGPLGYYPRYVDAEDWMSYAYSGVAILLVEALPIPPQLHSEDDPEPTPFWTPRTKFDCYRNVVPEGTGYAAGIRPIALLELPPRDHRAPVKYTEEWVQAWAEVEAPTMTRKEMIAYCLKRPKSERPVSFLVCRPQTAIAELEPCVAEGVTEDIAEGVTEGVTEGITDTKGEGS